MAKICGMTECPMYNTQHPMLAPLVSGKNPEILILTDSPDAKDTQRIFTTEAAKFLTDKLKSARIMTNKPIGIATAVRCYCDQNEMSESMRTKALKACKKYFVEHIKKYQPKLIISFGGMALTQATKQKGVKKYQGTFYKSEELNCHVFPLYASGYILRNQSHEETWNTGFNQIRNFIANGFKEDSVQPKQRILAEVQSIKNLFTKEEALDGIAIDTETQGLDWTHPLFTCVSYSIAPTADKGYQIFLFEECPEEEKDYSIKWTRKQKSKNVPTLVHVKRSENFEEKLRELRWFLENNKIKKIMHNGNYDCHVFKSLFKVAGRFLKWSHDKRHIDIQGYNFDTQNAAQLYNENVYQQARLETLQFAFTDITERYDSGDFKAAYEKYDMLSTPKHALTTYATLDSCVTKAASISLKKYLSDNKKLERYMTNMVMPTLETLREMEHNGIGVDKTALKTAQGDLSLIRDDFHAQALALIPQRIREAHEGKLSLTRTDLLKDILYSPDGFGIKPLVFTKAKQPSTDQDALKLVYDSIRSKSAKKFVDLFVQYKKHHTLVSTFLSGFDKHCACDGNVHTRYCTCNAVTGRTTSSQINLQNVPKHGDAAKIVRRILCAPPGWLIMKADASQAELRWIANESQDPEMIKVFRTDQDMHAVTATEMVNFGNTDKWSKLSQKEKDQKRDEAKAVNFGFCLRKGTKVITDIGIKNIEDIEIGDNVLTHKQRFRKVIALQSPMVCLSYCITTKSGKEIWCTPDHGMLVRKWEGVGIVDDFYPAEELIHGDCLVGVDNNIDPIVSLVLLEIPPETFYDFTVEEDHSFTADGLFTHNCYLMSVQGFVTYAKTDYGLDLDEETATAYQNAYFNKYRGLHGYYEHVTKLCKKQGYIEHALGRRRHLPEINSVNRREFNKAKKQLVNFPIQGPSSDTVLLAGNELRKMKLPRNDFRQCMFIHDELINLVREDCDIMKYAKIFKDAMEHPPIDKLFGVKFSVPFKTEIKIGKNINDCKLLEV